MSGAGRVRLPLWIIGVLGEARAASLYAAVYAEDRKGGHSHRVADWMARGALDAEASAVDEAAWMERGAK